MQNEQKRLHSTDIIKNQIETLQKNQEKIEADFVSIQADLKKVMNDFSDITKEMQKLANIQVHDKIQLTNQFKDVSSSVHNEVSIAKRRCNEIEAKVEKLTLKAELATSKCEESNSYIVKLEKDIEKFKIIINKFEQDKVDKTEMNNEISKIEDGIETLDRSVDIFDNKIKSLENYIDKYIPIQIQSMLAKSIKSVISSDTMAKHFKKHNEAQMTKFHENILNDEGVGNLEISMELLGGEASHVVKKAKTIKSKFHPGLEGDNAKTKKTAESNKNIHLKPNDHTLSELDIDPDDIIMEKSEVDSREASSVQPTPKRNEGIDHECK